MAQHINMGRVVRWAALLAISYLLTLPNIAQEDDRDTNTTYAAQVIIIYDDVTIQRAGTTIALPSPRGAITPLGAGDTLRTGAKGRAWVQYGDRGSFLILPRSSYTLHSYTDSGAGWQLNGTFQGTGVQRYSTLPTDYTMMLNDITITEAATHFSVWAFDFEPDFVTVADGRAKVVYQDGTITQDEITIAAGEGLRARPDGYDVQAFDAPLNAARLVASLEMTCDGVVRTDTGEDLLVREGAGQGFLARGLAPNGARVSVLGRTQSGNWTRTQYLSYYGWFLTLAIQVEPGCGGLPTFPDLSQERPQSRAFNVTADEIPLLRPFYGETGDDPWFYFYEAVSD